jgi:hypothetical protein
MTAPLRAVMNQDHKSDLSHATTEPSFEVFYEVKRARLLGVVDRDDEQPCGGRGTLARRVPQGVGTVGALPLERLAAIGEHSHLPRDQLVEFGTLDPIEVAVHDAATVPPANEAQQGPIAFNAYTFRQRVRDHGAQLRVVAVQQVGCIELVHASELYERDTPIRAASRPPDSVSRAILARRTAIGSSRSGTAVGSVGRGHLG